LSDSEEGPPTTEIDPLTAPMFSFVQILAALLSSDVRDCLEDAVDDGSSDEFVEVDWSGDD
jgi:hypothetical protein